MTLNAVQLHEIDHEVFTPLKTLSIKEPQIILTYIRKKNTSQASLEIRINSMHSKKITYQNNASLIIFKVDN